MPTTKLTPFMVSKDEWDTKEGPGKSMKNVLYVLRCMHYALAHLECRTVKNKSHSLSHYRVACLKASLVNKSVSKNSAE